ncbi:hypothetical protein GYMLUDRAFT_40149 [Collybiopsis luxurians FD-317 M1]|uniref:Aminotransferase class I/classII large domain-containing protein n=1 Tax=Collybiopsis luxurians FD-317 M1 TaxID=944289 RepID=A0A0D0CLQ9_9AGAR|nr:hypothetical protein GYMLUDRAFT_40149 [Collybiopsis luxurians FD-317 M1]
MNPQLMHHHGTHTTTDTAVSTTAGELRAESLPSEFYDQFLSDQAKEWLPSPIRGLLPLEDEPGIISLLSGKPNESTFPFLSLTFTAKDPASSTSERVITIPQSQLAVGLQYTDTAGIPDLIKWVIGLQEKVHGRKHGRSGVHEGTEGWRVSIGSGSQDLIYKAARSIISPGDPVLVESPVYAGVIPIFKSLQCTQIEVPTDANGICSSALQELLENWPDEKRPKVLYTVPYGCNPTGMTASLERRKEVLKLARQYNFIILEDDPYYYLYYGKAVRPPSYFALEAIEPTGEVGGYPSAEVGRVLRFDSLSKILSAGLRIGFASGPEPLLRKIDMLTANSNLQVSSFTQLITFRLLQSWGYDTFLAHTQSVSTFYKGKRDIFERQLQKWLGSDDVVSNTENDENTTGKLAEWVRPEAGMFFWFKLLVNSPETSEEEEDSKALIETHAFKNGVLALPGTVFLPNGSKSAYVRAAFSTLEEPQVEEAMRRLRKTVLEARKA